MKYNLKAIRKKDKKRALHLRRKARVRKIIFGSSERPRLSVFRSANHIYVQAIDDNQSKTIATSSSLDSSLKGEIKDKKKKEVAELVGAKLGEKLKSANLSKAVFDRNGFRYVGRVAALAEGLRKSGLNI